MARVQPATLEKFSYRVILHVYKPKEMVRMLHMVREHSPGQTVLYMKARLNATRDTDSVGE